MELFDILFPRTSLGGEDGSWMTQAEREACMQTPELLSGRRLGCTHLDSVAGAARYVHAPVLRAAVTRLKYRRSRAYIPLLSATLRRAVALLPVSGDTALCPVPLHWTRLLSRGFNQSELLARTVAPSVGCVLVALLCRTRRTGWQSHRRSRTERKGAMCGAFSMVRRTSCPPKHVILIDDVCTSGATLDACAFALKQGGVHRVDAAVVALG